MDYFAAMRSFVRATDLGSFSRAAEEASVKVSTVSRHVSMLEADLGAALLNRSTHGLHLTEIGRIFHEHATRILRDVDDVRVLAASLNTSPQGLLRVTVPAAFGRLHVMPHLSTFLAKYPAVRADVTLTDAHVDLIETGTDLAIRIGALPDSGLVARKVAPQKRIACASPAFLAGTEPIDMPTDIASREALVFTLQLAPTWHLRNVLSGARAVVKVSGRVCANDSEALRCCALAGQGVAALPTWLVHDDLARGELVRVLPGWEVGIGADVDRAIWAVYPPKKVVSPKVRAFINFYEACFGKPAYWEANETA